MDKQDIIAEFRAFTNCDEATADFFLSSCNYDLQMALNHFCEGRMDELADSAFPGATPPGPSRSTPSPSTGPGPALTHHPNVLDSASSPKTSTTSGSASTKAESFKPSDKRIVTMAQYRQSAGSGAGHDDEDEGQTFYAGGAEGGGGELVIGPRRPGHPSDHPPLTREQLSSTLFRAGHDLAERDRADAEAHGHPTPSSAAFTGSGFRLGSSNDTTPPPGTSATPGTGGQPGILKPLKPPGAGPMKRVVLKLWKDGLSLDDGPLREYADPKNRELIDYVKRGEIPPELREGLTSASDLDLQLEDHREQDYVPPKKMVKAFVGSGHVLGNEAPSHPSEFSRPSPPAAAAAAASTSSSTSSSSSSAPKPSSVDLPGLNVSAPTTHLQIRFSDGERITMRVNHSSTVGQIRQYLAKYEANRGRFGRPINLLTSYPAKPLNDDSVSVEGANLVNASLILK